MFALNMIFGDSKPEEEIKRLNESHKDTVIFTLVVASIASPGAMLAAVLLTENAIFSIFERAQTVLVMLAALVVAFVLMLLSEFITLFIGTSLVSRVMGLHRMTSVTRSIY